MSLFGSSGDTQDGVQVLPSGTTLLDESYTEIAFIGRGAFASVFKGCHVLTGKQCAIKIMNHESEEKKFIGHEKEAFQQLSHNPHPNIVPMYEWWSQRVDALTNAVVRPMLGQLFCKDEYKDDDDTHRSIFCISMQYCTGTLESLLSERDSDFFTGDVNAFVESGGLLKERQFTAMARSEHLEVMKQICDGLQFLHRNKIIHRDLKPANILYLDTPDGRFFKISDFGLSKLLTDDALRDTMTQCGTFYYSAPEQFTLFSYTEKVDIHSLGVILLRLVYPMFAANELKDSVKEMRRTGKCPPGLEELCPEMSSLIKDMYNIDADSRIGLQSLITMLSSMTDY